MTKPTTPRLARLWDEARDALATLADELRVHGAVVESEDAELMRLTLHRMRRDVEARDDD